MFRPMLLWPSSSWIQIFIRKALEILHNIEQIISVGTYTNNLFYIISYLYRFSDKIVSNLKKVTAALAEICSW